MRRAVALACLAAACAAAQQIRLESAGARSWFRVEGAAPGGRLAVFVDTAPGASPDATPMLGSSRAEGGSLVFDPRFPLQPGLRYRAEFRPASGPPVIATFEIPRPAAAVTRLEHVYPSADRLPENQLKLYLHFSAPMSRGEAYRRVQLLENGRGPVELPFLELAEELWDPDGKRLTLLFDPGRVKQDLLPRREAGPALEAGKSYTLVIDGAFLDASSRPLDQEYRKTFQVGPADRDPPDPKTWRLGPPSAASTEPLSLELPEPMDQALLESLLEVTDLRGQAVAGSVEVDRQETRWRFRPAAPWQPGNYIVLVGKTLEDLAGNSIGRPFEVDVFERVTERIARETARLPFAVR